MDCVVLTSSLLRPGRSHLSSGGRLLCCTVSRCDRQCRPLGTVLAASWLKNALCRFNVFTWSSAAWKQRRVGVGFTAQRGAHEEKAGKKMSNLLSWVRTACHFDAST